MAKAKDSDIELVFPEHGVDVSVEFDRQPDGTTPVGQNVRLNETFQLRDRGGSRPGIGRWIDEQPEGNHKVQHLNTVLHYSVVNLLTQDEQVLLAPGPFAIPPEDSPWPDLIPPGAPGGGPNPIYGPPDFNTRMPPATPRYNPPGGSGVPPNRHVGQPPPPPPSPPVVGSFVQAASTTTGSPTGSVVVSPASPVAFQSSLIVVVANLKGTAPAVSVTDNESHTYQLLKALTVTDFFGNELSLAMYGLYWRAVTEAATVTVTFAPAADAATVAVLNYNGLRPSGVNDELQLEGSDSGFVSLLGPPAAVTAGTPATAATPFLLLGAFVTDFEGPPNTFVPKAGFTTRVTRDQNIGPNLWVEDRLGAAAAEAVTGTISEGTNACGGVSASVQQTA